MSSKDFAYWLQGYFEISGPTQPLTVDQVHIIKKHLALVFYHEIDPSYTDDPKKQEEMNSIHNNTINSVLPGVYFQSHPISAQNYDTELMRC